MSRPGLADISASLGELLRAAAPGADAALVRRVASTTVTTADALLRQAFREHPNGDEHVLAEARTLLRGYVAARLDIHPEP